MTTQNSLPAFDGVIFDLDGTLYHMKWFMRPLLFLRLLPHGDWLPAYMKVRRTLAGQDFGTEYQLLEALSTGLAQKVKAEQAQTFSWICRSFYPAFVASMKQFKGSRPGLEDVLRRLRAAGRALAVLSDFGMIRPRLAGLGIDPDLFDTIVSSEGEGALKPNPRPFCSIANLWSMPCERILVVGDRDDTDGAASRACSMSFLQITDKASGRNPRGCVVWPQVRELLDKSIR